MEKAEGQDGMEQAEHDPLANLRRARRSLRLQGMDEPPGGCAPDAGAVEAVATVMGSWGFIIVQSRAATRTLSRSEGRRQAASDSSSRLVGVALSDKVRCGRARYSDASLPKCLRNVRVKLLRLW
jgi:hypothetical protein